jgi:6-phosphogluconolactonase
MSDNSGITTTEGGSIRIRDVEPELMKLWAQVAESEGEHAILRATTLNLILYTNNTRSAPGLIGQVSEAHPCRAIVIEIDGEAPDTLQASPTVFCRPSLGSGSGRTQVCCEEIIITAGRDAVSRIPGAVQALLLTDLPVYVFHQGNLTTSDLIVRGLGEVMDGLIIDSSGFEDLASAFHDVVTLLHTPHFHAALFDLNWQRLLPWRRALAQCFERSTDRAALKSMREIEITHHDARAQALLLMGWLVSRLHWQIIPLSSDPNVWQVRSGKDTVTLRLQGVDSGTTGIKQISVTADNQTFSIAPSQDASCLIAREKLTINLLPDSTGALISAVLTAGSRDRIFEEAISTAALLTTEAHVTAQRAAIVIAPNPAGLAARYFVQAARHAIEQDDQFTVALSGGSTPKALYTLLAQSPYRDQVDWSKVHFFWGDERNVSTDNADSNQKMTYDALLSQIPIPPRNIHGIEVGSLSADEAAKHYADEIRGFFKLKGDELPEFDLVLLGMGDDGHTASLFPHTDALKAPGSLLFVANPVPKLNTTRLTLTADVINNALLVMFLITGTGKADILQKVFKGKLKPDEYPAQRIQPEPGSLMVIADKDAAAKIR